MSDLNFHGVDAVSDYVYRLIKLHLEIETPQAFPSNLSVWV